MYVCTCIEGLPFDSLLESDIYIEIGGRIRLYRGKNYPFTREDLERLLHRGVRDIYISETDWKSYIRQVSSGVDEVMESRTVPAGTKAKILRECASDVVDQVVSNPGAQGVQQRTLRLMEHIRGWISSESNALFALLKSPTQYDEFARHGANVCFYSTALGIAMDLFSAEEAVHFSLTALLHDIGLLKVSPSTLRKSRPSEEDWKTLRRHSLYGPDVLTETDFAAIVEKTDCLEPLLQHHERPDGTGYPLGLRGDEIHPLAAVIALTDIFDGKTTDWGDDEK